MNATEQGTRDQFRVLLEAAPDTMVILNQTTCRMNSELGLQGARETGASSGQGS